eukprot:TRINITY_DN3470_c0_g1_i2.p1 TRINITY_DN3470_c0_g1~~TRINITY_DN3470_c0_g1_i2.p1  ORF type:complete len:870 (+),score=166.45 TRINITY_DN3470_c0_g1_i2:43-2652(+)
MNVTQHVQSELSCGDVGKQTAMLLRLQQQALQGEDVSIHFTSIAQGCLDGCENKAVRKLAYHVLRHCSASDSKWKDLIAQVTRDITHEDAELKQAAIRAVSTFPVSVAVEFLRANTNAMLGSLIHGNPSLRKVAAECIPHILIKCREQLRSEISDIWKIFIELLTDHEPRVCTASFSALRSIILEYTEGPFVDTGNVGSVHEYRASVKKLAVTLFTPLASNIRTLGARMKCLSPEDRWICLLPLCELVLLSPNATATRSSDLFQDDDMDVLQEKSNFENDIIAELFAPQLSLGIPTLTIEAGRVILAITGTSDRDQRYKVDVLKAFVDLFKKLEADGAVFEDLIKISAECIQDIPPSLVPVDLAFSLLTHSAKVTRIDERFMVGIKIMRAFLHAVIHIMSTVPSDKPFPIADAFYYTPTEFLYQQNWFEVIWKSQDMNPPIREELLLSFSTAAMEILHGCPIYQKFIQRPIHVGDLMTKTIAPHVEVAALRLMCDFLTSFSSCLSWNVGLRTCCLESYLNLLNNVYCLLGFAESARDSKEQGVDPDAALLDQFYVILQKLLHLLLLELPSISSPGIALRLIHIATDHLDVRRWPSDEGISVAVSGLVQQIRSILLGYMKLKSNKSYHGKILDVDTNEVQAKTQTSEGLLVVQFLLRFGFRNPKIAAKVDQLFTELITKAEASTHHRLDDVLLSSLELSRTRLQRKYSTSTKFDLERNSVEMFSDPNVVPRYEVFDRHLLANKTGDQLREAFLLTYRNSGKSRDKGQINPTSWKILTGASEPIVLEICHIAQSDRNRITLRLKLYNITDTDISDVRIMFSGPKSIVWESPSQITIETLESKIATYRNLTLSSLYLYSFSSCMLWMLPFDM